MLMLHSLLIKLGSGFVALGMLFGGHAAAQPTFGAVNPVGSTQFTLSGAGITSTQNTIPLTSFTTPDGRKLTMSMFGTIGYGALEPQTTAKLEDITFTGITQNVNGTATLTGVTRGNDFVTPYAASTTLAHSHSGGATFILTNTAGFYTQFASVNNAQTISGIWTFGSTSPPRYDADPIWGNFSTQVLADVAYVNSVVAGGAANASETVKGIIQLATGAQAALGTSLGSTGARLVVPASLATSTPYSATPAGSFPVSNAIGGKLSQLWLDLTQAFTFSGPVTFSGVVSATNTLIAPNGNKVAPAFGGTGVDGALSITSGTTTINLASASYVIKNYTSISITGTGALAFSNPAAGGTVVILKSQGNVTLTSSAAPMITASGLGSSGGAANNVQDGFVHAGNSGTAPISPFFFASTAGGGGGDTSAGGAGAKSTLAWVAPTDEFGYIYPNAFVGSGGGAGGMANTTGGGTATAGIGGNGGGCVVIESAGAWNFTTTNGISVAGTNGTAGTNAGNASSGKSVGQGGAGGTGGYFLALYNTLTANTGTINIGGGTGGAGSIGATNTGDVGSGGSGGNPLTAGTAGGHGTSAQAGASGISGSAVVLQNTYR